MEKIRMTTPLVEMDGDEMTPQDPKAELRENLWDKIISGCDLVDTV